jgi:hypothetical protein
MGKNEIEQNDFKKFVVLLFFEAIKKSSPEVIEVLTRNGDSHNGPDKQSYTEVGDFSLCAS